MWDYDMARFRFRLKPLMLKKGMELGKNLTQRDLAKDSGISLTTISRLSLDAVDRIDADTVERLMTYFGVHLEELVEVESDKRDPRVKYGPYYIHIQDTGGIRRDFFLGGERELENAKQGENKMLKHVERFNSSDGQINVVYVSQLYKRPNQDEILEELTDFIQMIEREKGHS